MKLNLILMLSFFLAIPVVSLAASKNSKNVKIESPTIVANQQLKPGTYKVEWNENGTSNVQVAFLKNNREVLTAPAKLLEESSSSPHYGPDLVEHNGWGKAKILDEIDFKNIALNFQKAGT